jgi:hypothetical protein
MMVSERKKIKRTNLGLAKIDKQLDEWICVLFLSPLKTLRLFHNGWGLPIDSIKNMLNQEE